jgi:hypothetical protein
MTDEERRINEAAKFHPARRELERDGSGFDTYPMIEVGGVQVYAYFTEGVLHVSLDYDTPDPEVVAEDGAVPTEVTASGELVWSA